MELLARLVEGDARAALNGLEVALALAEADERHEVVVADIEAARSTRAVRYGEDEHYDIISAFIKSIRGSDADAGLYWLARMLEAGEDARFIARRLVILASEDVGMADPRSLLVADAAARAVEFVGLPEAQLNLAHAVVHLANAPKSNSVTAALGRAGRTSPRRPPAPCPGTCATLITPARPASATGRATSTPTTSPAVGWPSSTGPTTSRGAPIGSPPGGARTFAGRPAAVLVALSKLARRCTFPCWRPPTS